MHILILAPYPPYPPYGGGTMRMYQLVRGLAARHSVTCLTFAPDAASEQALEPLRTCCRVLVVRGPAARRGSTRAWTTVTSPLPDMALRNQSPAYTAALTELLGREQFTIIQAESIEMAPYLLQLGQHQGLRVFDQFNAEYVIQKRAAQTSFQALRRGTVNARTAAGAVYSAAQWLKLARFERQAMAACDLVLAVSSADRATMLRLDPTLAISVVPNGVDSAAFSRAALATEQVGPIRFRQPTLVFSGTLDYRPNIDALRWFTADVLPLLQISQPNLRLVVVGKRPVAEVRSLAGGALVLVGEVADARPYIAAADVYIVPMRIGGGVRLKLLEALSLAAPVVSTEMGAEGVEGLRTGEHCLIASDPAAFAAACQTLLAEREYATRLGQAGRALVQENYDWQTIIPRLEAGYRELRTENQQPRTVNEVSAMRENQRQQHLLERVQEDERMRGDLAGAAATALVGWASAHVAAASADPNRPDGEVEQAVVAVRQAASQSARSGETEPEKVVALAENLLQRTEARSPATIEEAAAPSPELPATTPSVSKRI